MNVTGMHSEVQSDRERFALDPCIYEYILSSTCRSRDPGQNVRECLALLNAADKTTVSSSFD